MPLYEYQCDACGQRFEVIHKFSDPPADVCTECGKGPVKRLFSSPAIQFKGSGWYITDYAQKGKSDTKPTEKSEGTKTDGAQSEGAAKTDTAAKSETASKGDKAPASAGSSTSGGAKD